MEGCNIVLSLKEIFPLELFLKVTEFLICYFQRLGYINDSRSKLTIIKAGREFMWKNCEALYRENAFLVKVHVLRDVFLFY